MQHDTAHMGIVEIKNMAHLTICKGCVKQSKLKIVSNHSSLLLSADFF